MLSEALKLTVSAAFFSWTNPGIASSSSNSTSHSLVRILATRHQDAAIPAILYTIATLFQSTGAYNLDLLPYLVLSQSKIIISPIFAVIFIGQKFAFRQWFCFILMAFGIVLVQTGSTTTLTQIDSRGLSAPRSTPIGVVCMLFSGFCVALAGVHVEKMLRTSKPFMVRSAQLAWYSFICATIGFLWSSKAGFSYFFRGYDKLVWISVMLQATGGFLVAWCVSLTSTVIKNHAQGLGFLLASTLPLLSSRETNYQVSKKKIYYRSILIVPPAPLWRHPCVVCGSWVSMAYS